MEIDILQELYDPDEEFDTSHLKAIDDFIKQKETECLQNYTEPEAGTTYCPRAFDSLTCWNETLAGQISYARCPTIIPGFDPRKLAFRECTRNGTWATHYISGREWSNYTTCINFESIQTAEFVNHIYIVGYSISAVAIVIGLVIFCSYSSLQCTRVTIHKNLFLSFLFTDIMWIVLYKQVIEKPKVLMLNMVWCQVWYILIQYFYIVNHQWMFCEGLYLHLLLSLTFVNERRLMSWFYIIGWILPIPILVTYVSLRILYEKSNYECWIHENNHSLSYYVLSAPLVISLVANLCFLFNIIRLLLTKLKTMPGAHQNCGHKRGSLLSDQGNRGSKETMLQISVKDHGRAVERIATKQSIGQREERNMTFLEVSEKDVQRSSNGEEATKDLFTNGQRSRFSFFGTNISDNISFYSEPACSCVYKKAVRATLFLVPLLGLHFLLSPFSEQDPQLPVTVSDDVAEEIANKLEGAKKERIVYDILLALAASFQGFCVSLLYCILNGEVMALFRRKLERFRAKRENSQFPHVKILVKTLRRMKIRLVQENGRQMKNKAYNLEVIQYFKENFTNRSSILCCN
ncbi:calcitonin gene-related peptide type 1 receptor-like isoform X2 [Artemia franciscana]|uniref:calcitonin gene-related peptide type 1 receptor-like isoform X2 n=1 Tax=Artemia franciscana TaxID=6661 RepID=UPI0032DB7D94